MATLSNGATQNNGNGSNNNSSSSNSIIHSSGNNKRKRRPSLDETDDDNIENKRPCSENSRLPLVPRGDGDLDHGDANIYYSLDDLDEKEEDEVEEELGESDEKQPLADRILDEYVTTAASLVSPTAINNVLSPLTVCDYAENRGELTPHGNHRSKAKKSAKNKKNVHHGKGSSAAADGEGGAGLSDDDEDDPDKETSCTQLPCYVSPQSELRQCPMPPLTWADAKSVWQQMCRKDDRSLLARNPNMLAQHPGLMLRMRAILLDWLIEVCEVYKLHRETYYLATDYLDRYLSVNQDVSKTRLQLIGITCLFIAAKVEEIYPPKIGEFAYVTDGACNEEDIQLQELNLLQTLGWNVSPITPISWLGVYLQVEVNNRTMMPYPSKARAAGAAASAPASRHLDPQLLPSNTNSLVNMIQQEALIALATPAKSPMTPNCASSGKKMPMRSTPMHGTGDQEDQGGDSAVEQQCGTRHRESFLFPQFSGLDFAQAAQLIDLCSLDVGIAQFAYSVVAATAICHVFNRRVALQVSGLTWDENMAKCYKWMEPFYAVILEDNTMLFLLEQNEQVPQNFGLHSVCPNLTKDDSYKQQTHAITLDMFDKVVKRREEEAAAAWAAEQERLSQQKPELQQSRSKMGATASTTSLLAAEHTLSPCGLLTPPASSRKSLDTIALAVTES